jgi:hypothetical protein
LLTFLVEESVESFDSLISCFVFNKLYSFLNLYNFKFELNFSSLVFCNLIFNFLKLSLSTFILLTSLLVSTLWSTWLQETVSLSGTTFILLTSLLVSTLWSTWLQQTVSLSGTNFILLTSLLVSSPGPKVHVNYCHHLASVVRCLLSVVCCL